MLAQWRGDIVGEMHIHRIRSGELAAEVGWHEKYLSAVLNGRRDPAGAEEKLRSALERLVERSVQS